MHTNVNGEVECPACGFVGDLFDFPLATGADEDEGDLVCPSCGEVAPFESLRDEWDS